MTKEDIIKMAREAGWMHDHDSETGFVAEAAIKFAALVAAAERDACAKVCDSEKKWWNGMSHAENDIYQTLDNVSALIRARQ